MITAPKCKYDPIHIRYAGFASQRPRISDSNNKTSTTSIAAAIYVGLINRRKHHNFLAANKPSCGHHFSHRGAHHCHHEYYFSWFVDHIHPRLHTRLMWLPANPQLPLQLQLVSHFPGLLQPLDYPFSTCMTDKPLIIPSLQKPSHVLIRHL